MKHLPVFLLLIFVVIACKQEESSAKKNVITEANDIKKVDQISNSKINVTLDFKIENIDDGKPVISGQSNLPDGTELGIWIQGKSQKYNAQTNVQVENNKFESETFSNNYSKLIKGVYEVSVSMPIASTQPQKVQAVIGKNGENLEGSLVKKSIIEGTGNVVKAVKTFEIK